MNVQARQTAAAKKHSVEKLRRHKLARGRLRDNIVVDKRRAAPKPLNAAQERADASASRPNLASQLRSQMQLTQPLFSRLLPASVRTVAKLESGGEPTEVVARRLKELLRLINALSEVIEKKSLARWLQTPNSAFDDLKPLEVIERGESDRIWSMIFFLRSGVPS